MVGFSSLFLLASGFTWRGRELFLNKKTEQTKNNYLFDFDDNLSIDNYNDNNSDNLEYLPLLPEAIPVFPGSRKIIFLNEMKFRALIQSSISNYDSYLVRTFVDSDTGGIDPIGLKCKIVESRNLKDGQVCSIIEASERINIHSIEMEDNQFLIGKISLQDNIDDNNNIDENDNYCFEILNILKSYLRLTAISKVALGADPDTAKEYCFTPNIMRNLPLPYESTEKKLKRHEDFSYAVGNLVRTTPMLMQQLLKESTNQRLKGLLKIVETGFNELKDEINQDKVVSQDDIARIVAMSNDKGDIIEDLFPPVDYVPLSLKDILEEDEEVVELALLNENDDEDILQ